MRQPLAALAVVLLASVASAAHAQAPTISNPELYTKSLEVAWHALDQYDAYDNPAELKRVNDIGYRVARESNFTKFPFTFHLVDMPEPNAFALPAGHIFVTRGMLDLGLSDDMLAALLGHEVAHVVEEHYLHMKKKSTLMSILSQALLAGVLITADNRRDDQPKGPRAPYDPRVGVDTGGDLVQGAAAASLVVNELLLRSYSRENESESDREGQRWAAAAGFSTRGAADLMGLMGSRLPQDKKYGYWMTHPFFDERVRSAETFDKLLKTLEPDKDDVYRQRTQALLLTFLKEEKLEEKLIPLVKEEALAAWPQGSAAEDLRLERLHRQRDEELALTPMRRDYGGLLEEYREQIAEVTALTPESAFLKALEKEVASLEKDAAGLYPKALEVLAEGIYETPFLEAFLSNYPEAPEIPRVALSLGDAQARLGNQTEAVESYLRSWQSGPETSEGKRAALGLRHLAPTLDQLAALQQLALQQTDLPLAQLASDRLREVVGKFQTLPNGAEYLRRFPDGEHSDRILERLNLLADNLYAEVVLYQTVGDHVKAIDRINQILTFAPSSQAAERLRDRAVVPG